MGRRGRASGWVLALLASIPMTALLLLVLEVSLRPFASLGHRTTLFQRDADLGWKLRPGTHAWGGVPVHINDKGLRGPERSYAKPAGMRRILFLGDSVTFGFRMREYEETFPHAVERLWNERHGVEVQTINAGVDGYSPWQEYRYLHTEGLRYQPDLLVVGFVLNDVTEKLNLHRFGGWSEGYQLSRSAASWREWLADRTAIGFFLQRAAMQLQFGEDAASGAKAAEIMRIEALVEQPDHPEIRRAWEITVANLGKIFQLAGEHQIPVLLVTFPYTFQLDESEAKGGPQRILDRVAQQHGIAHLDLLPPLAAYLADNDTPAHELFLDDNHLSPRGAALVARLIVEKIESAELLL